MLVRTSLLFDSPYAYGCLGSPRFIAFPTQSLPTKVAVQKRNNKHITTNTMPSSKEIKRKSSSSRRRLWDCLTKRDPSLIEFIVTVDDSDDDGSFGDLFEGFDAQNGRQYAFRRVLLSNAGVLGKMQTGNPKGPAKWQRHSSSGGVCLGTRKAAGCGCFVGDDLRRLGVRHREQIHTERMDRRR